MPRQPLLEKIQPEQFGVRRHDLGIEEEDPGQILRPIRVGSFLRRPLQGLMAGA